MTLKLVVTQFHSPVFGEMMTRIQRNVSLAVTAILFGGYAILELTRGHGRSAYEAVFLGVMISSAILLVARSSTRPRI